MRAALQQELVPHLRRRGFSGSFPNFRRMTDTDIALLTVQFNKYGGSFTIELGRAAASDYARSPGELIRPFKLSANELPLGQRARLYPTPGDPLEWFSYPNTGGPNTGGSRFLRSGPPSRCLGRPERPPAHAGFGPILHLDSSAAPWRVRVCRGGVCLSRCAVAATPRS